MNVARKKKKCLECGKDRYIFSKGRCYSCANREYLKKRKEKKVRNTLKQKKRKNGRSERSKLIEKLDRVFSQYIRKKNMNRNGEVYCFTSQRIYNWKSMQAGHFIGRGRMPLRWNEYNVFPQSRKDNCFLDGNVEEYRKNLTDIYSKTFVENLILQGERSIEYSEEDLREMIKVYKDKLDSLKPDPFVARKYDTVSGSMLVVAIDPEGLYICKMNGSSGSMKLLQKKTLVNLI